MNTSDGAKVGRSSVRRRARGMTHSEAVAALEEAELHAHLDRRDEAAADDGGRRAAELAEWQRVVQLLAATGGPYGPDADVVVQEELAEDRRREEAEQQRRREQQRVADRAEELARLSGAGRLDRSVPRRAGDEAARELLDENRDYRVTEVNAWLARSLADQSGHYADPAARMAAVGSLPVPVRAHAALLAALARTGPVDGDLEFVGRLAQADPAATTALAAWLDNAWNNIAEQFGRSERETPEPSDGAAPSTGPEPS
ncbi:hypothetical protein OH717_34605 (plasmid) [Streptomyces albidoflavus]|uniref:hypothetical protein n=1 Tax=Streptomyces TaxID=1883 RepID=UPI002F90B149|nr:hypothetical protein OH717_33895 [Streptomyces albidoflavus]WTD07698.1 hypothetical protein OH717_34605 [Streptomyces albidoflavus]